jgi:type I restriction enzyme S subunit
LNESTILLGINGTIGNVAIYYNEKCILGKSACYINVDENFDRSFIKYVLLNTHFQNYIKTNATGSTIKNVGLKTLREYEVLIPSSKNEQHRIAEILSALDDKVELNRRMNQTLEQMAQTLFRKYFVDGIDEGNPPEGWTVCEVGDYISSVSITHNFHKPQIIFLNTGDILNGDILHRNYSDAESLPGQAKKSIQENDILFTEIRPANKRFAYINFEANDYVVSTKLMVLRAKAELNSLFFYFLLTREVTLKELQNQAEARSGTFPQITFDQVKIISFNKPNDDSLHNFIENTLTPTYKKIFKYKEEIKTLTQLRDTLLPRLMAGEIDVTQTQPVPLHEPVLS